MSKIYPTPIWDMGKYWTKNFFREKWKRSPPKFKHPHKSLEQDTPGIS